LSSGNREGNSIPGWVAGKATKQTHGVRRRLGAARVTGQLQRQDASFPQIERLLAHGHPGAAQRQHLEQSKRRSNPRRNRLELELEIPRTNFDYYLTAIGFPRTNLKEPSSWDDT